MDIKQIIFSIVLLLTVVTFLYTATRLYSFFKLTKPAYPIKNIAQRIKLTIVNGLLQDRIFRNPIAGIMHALVFWGFLVILIGSIEMVIDGVLGTERILAFAGGFYNLFMALGDIFAYLIALFIIIFIIRRCCLNINRLHGKELSKKNHQDAYFALFMIFILMITLGGMNVFYLLEKGSDYVGNYPVSKLISPFFAGMTYNSIHLLHEINWWAHILLIFIFANVLPYSKHFHIFMSIPNVFFSRLEPLGKLPNMESITKEVKIMLDPNLAYSQPAETSSEVERFGVLDVEDINWKYYIDSLTCTQCGRCSAVCPANITGKDLSPRKLFIDIRKRMKEKGPLLLKNGKAFSDGKTLIRDYIGLPEIWACTTCNACAKECPLNINHPTFIIDMRRYLVMEEASAPAELNAIFANIENNGAPWQYSHEDRLKWTE